MKNNKELLKAIEGLKEIRRNPPKEWTKSEIQVISWTLDFLEEELLKQKVDK